MSTFVSVGNTHQPFTRLLHAVAANALDLPQPVIVQHGHTPFGSNACRAVPFFEMSEFERLIAGSSLIIVQAGGGGILHALRSGKVPVVVPRQQRLGEHIDDHQVSWGRALSKTGRVVLVEDVSQLMLGVRQALGQQQDFIGQTIEIALINLVRDALGGRLSS
jgi:UDP-N-acetylglucosamine transferase subunit ALG13